MGGDGTITNRFGETMVYDSSGNLAPAPRATPVEPGIAPVVGGEVPGGAFPVVPIAGGAFPGAEVPGEAFPVAPVAPVVVPQPTGIDKVLVEKYGYEFVNGKAYAPGKAPAPALAPVSPDLAPTPQPVVPEYDSRFENENAAISYAQNSGQGALTVGGDGTITNRFGETMVYDSSGNLAPAPRATPVGNDPNVGPAVVTPDPVAAAKAMQAARAAEPGYVAPAIDPVAVAEAAAADRARAAAAAAQATQAAADAAAQAAAANSSRFETEDAAISYAQNSGQGALTVGGDGTITNRFGETMVYDSSGNLAPAPRATPVGNDPNVGPAVVTPDPVDCKSNASCSSC